MQTIYRKLLVIGVVVGGRGSSVFAACTQTLNPGANIASAVSGAVAGSTVCLNSGVYGAVTLAGVSKANYVTVQSVSAKGATLGYVSIGNSDFIRFDSVVLGGGIINSCSQHIQITNSQFTDGITLRNDGCTPTSNLDITLDGNTFNGLGTSTWEGRLSIAYSDNPSGIVITKNIFGGGGCSDGIQLVGNAGGVRIGPGNIFKDLVQGSCGPHVDSIQMYGAGPGNRIEGNYFVNNTVYVGIYDGGSGVTIKNNVFDAPNDTNYYALQLGGIDTMLMEHNTFKSVKVAAGTKSGDSPNSGWTVQNNLFDSAYFDAAGDQPGCGADCVMRYNLKSRGGTTSPTGTNSVTGNAVYVGAGSSSNWPGWQLAGGSPGENAGNDGQDMGILTYGSAASPPSAPRNLSVR